MTDANSQRLRPCRYDLNMGPRDPLSGISLALLDAVFGICGGVKRFTHTFKRNRRSQSLSDMKETETETKHRVTNASFDGIGDALAALLRAPVQVGMGLTQGFHNAPKIWGDKIIRSQIPIHGISSGIKAGYKQFTLSAYDGVTGFVSKPMQRSKQHKLRGTLAGLSIGTLSGISNIISGFTAVITFPLKGVEVELSQYIMSKTPSLYEISLLQQGLEEASCLNQNERVWILEEWQNLIKRYQK